MLPSARLEAPHCRHDLAIQGIHHRVAVEVFGIPSWINNLPLLQPLHFMQVSHRTRPQQVNLFMYLLPERIRAPALIDTLVQSVRRRTPVSQTSIVIEKSLITGPVLHDHSDVRRVIRCFLRRVTSINTSRPYIKTFVHTNAMFVTRHLARDTTFLPILMPFTPMKDRINASIVIRNSPNDPILPGMSRNYILKKHDPTIARSMCLLYSFFPKPLVTQRETNEQKKKKAIHMQILFIYHTHTLCLLQLLYSIMYIL